MGMGVQTMYDTCNRESLQNDAYHGRDCSVSSEVPPPWRIPVDFTRRKLGVSETLVHIRELLSGETEVPTLSVSKSLGPKQCSLTK